MPDTRYLKQRGGRWSFQIAVPKDLQPTFGREVIVKSLKTSDLRTAQNDRWVHVATWKSAFKKAREGDGLTSDEIELEAQSEYRQLSANMVVQPNIYQEGAAGQTSDPVTLALSEWIHDTQWDLRDEDYSRVEKQVDEVIERTGANLEKQARDELAQAFMRSHIAAFSDAISLRQGEEPPPVRTLNTARKSIGRVRARRGKGMPISQAAREFVQEKTRDPETSWTAQTKKQCEAVFRLFADHVGDSPIDTVTRDDAINFRAAVARLNPNWARSVKARGKPLSDLLKEYSVSDGQPGLSARTLERYTSALASLFSWLRDRGIYEEANPFSRLGTAKNSAKKLQKQRTKNLPFEPEELMALFSSPHLSDSSYQDRVTPKSHTARTTLMWMPLISLFTGMRSGEIAQLRPSDVRQENGVEYFWVAEEGVGQQVKTAESYRRVTNRTFAFTPEPRRTAV